MSGGVTVMPFVAVPAVLLGFVGLLLACGKEDPSVCEPWAAWQSYKSAFLTPDGRVVASDDSASVSEGQAYALFFALVGNDRKAFEQILRWTENNLAGGDLTARLPAWRWGKRDDQSWGVLDANAASDADLWIAYTLNESGRLWKIQRHSALALLLAQRVLREETADIPGLGPTLLPGPQGFAAAGKNWRLNPSYSPIQILRRMKSADPDPRWDRIIESSRRVIAASAPKGYAPDWVEFSSNQGFAADSRTQAKGSYDAIRVYLWAGLMSDQDQARRELLTGLKPMADQVAARGRPPESVNAVSGETHGDGPPGFSAALIPFLEAAGQDQAAQVQAQRVAAGGTAKSKPGYFDQSLMLFGMGWKDGRYRFDTDGALLPRWPPKCAAAA